MKVLIQQLLVIASNKALVLFIVNYKKLVAILKHGKAAIELSVLQQRLPYGSSILATRIR